MKRISYVFLTVVLMAACNSRVKDSSGQKVFDVSVRADQKDIQLQKWRSSTEELVSFGTVNVTVKNTSGENQEFMVDEEAPLWTLWKSDNESIGFASRIQAVGLLANFVKVSLRPKQSYTKKIDLTIKKSTNTGAIRFKLGFSPYIYNETYVLLSNAFDHKSRMKLKNTPLNIKGTYWSNEMQFEIEN